MDGLFQKFVQISHTHLLGRVVGVEVLANGVEHGGGPGVGAVLPHALHHAVDGPDGPGHTVGATWRFACYHLVGLHLDALGLARRNERIANAGGALVEQAILRPLKVPRVPMRLGLHGLVEQQVVDDVSVKFFHTIFPQHPGHKLQVVGREVGVGAALEDDASAQQSIGHAPLDEKRGLVVVMGAEQMVARHPRQQLHA